VSELQVVGAGEGGVREVEQRGGCKVDYIRGLALITQGRIARVSRLCCHPLLSVDYDRLRRLCLPFHLEAALFGFDETRCASAPSSVSALTAVWR
jgi:hypothetical protein